MFGISFTEIFVIAIVTLVVVGPQKLPAMLSTLGRWVGKIRRISSEMRQQTGIDDLLRQEGLHGGLNELKSLMRGQAGYGGPARRVAPTQQDPVEFDPSREYPVEGPDSYNAVADDLLDEDESEEELAGAQVTSPYPEGEEAAPHANADAAETSEKDGKSSEDTPPRDEPASGSRA